MAQYDPKKNTVVVDEFILTGFPEDTFISAERDTEKRSLDVGAQGSVDVNKSANDTGKVTITLKANSPSNAKLKELYEQDDTFYFYCSDQNIDGDVGVLGSQCVIENLPTYERGSELGTNEWTLLVFDYEQAFETDY